MLKCWNWQKSFWQNSFSELLIDRVCKLAHANWCLEIIGMPEGLEGWKQHKKKRMIWTACGKKGLKQFSETVTLRNRNVEMLECWNVGIGEKVSETEN